MKLNRARASWSFETSWQRQKIDQLTKSEWLDVKITIKNNHHSFHHWAGSPFCSCFHFHDRGYDPKGTYSWKRGRKPCVAQQLRPYHDFDKNWKNKEDTPDLYSPHHEYNPSTHTYKILPLPKWHFLSTCCQAAAVGRLAQFVKYKNCETVPQRSTPALRLNEINCKWWTPKQTTMACTINNQRALLNLAWVWLWIWSAASAIFNGSPTHS